MHYKKVPVKIITYLIDIKYKLGMSGTNCTTGKVLRKLLFKKKSGPRP
jgi:hypothetical protein